MEPATGTGAGAVAALAAQKWYGVMGLLGLFIFWITWFVVIPYDPVIPRCLGLMMMGWGFGQAECRYSGKSFVRIGASYLMLTVPSWHWTVSGVLLFAIFAGAAIWLLLHLIGVGPF